MNNTKYDFLAGWPEASKTSPNVCSFETGVAITNQINNYVRESCEEYEERDRNWIQQTKTQDRRAVLYI